MVALRDGLRWITQGAWVSDLPDSFQWLGLSQRAYPWLAAAVVRGGVERLTRSALREDAVVGVATHLERDDACEVRFEREHLDVEQQLHVLGERVGHSRRRVRQLTRLAVEVPRLDGLDPALDLLDVLEITVEAHPIGGAQLFLQGDDLGVDPVENALADVASRLALDVFGRATRLCP